MTSDAIGPSTNPWQDQRRNRRPVPLLAHGGTLALHDRQPHGLVTRILLPVHQQTQKSAA
jgi:hypothetical protein